MSYVSLIPSCSDSSSPFAYSVGCSATADSWTTANSATLAPVCNTDSYTYTITSNCFLNTNEPTDNGLLDSEGGLLITEFDDFLILG